MRIACAGFRAMAPVGGCATARRTAVELAKAGIA
jgi:hypothetical protein